MIDLNKEVSRFECLLIVSSVLVIVYGLDALCSL